MRNKNSKHLVLAGIVVVCGFLIWAWFAPSTSIQNDPIRLLSSPVVSPSGDKVAFVVTRQGRYTFDAAELFSGRFVVDDILFQPLNVHLSILSLEDGQVSHTGVETDIGSSPLTWSPDGLEIALVTREGNGMNSLDLKTHHLTCLEPFDIRSPKFSPQGNYLGYLKNGNLVIQSASTGYKEFIRTDVAYYWCWAPTEENVFYIKTDAAVCQFNLRSNSETILFTPPLSPSGKTGPSHVVPAPDGSRVGYEFDGWFYVIDLRSGETEKLFPCDHYFLDFDWNNSGICYIDACGGNRKSMANLMFFDLRSGQSTLIATGSFSYPRWLSSSKILVRKGNTELLAYDINTKEGVHLFTDDTLAPENPSEVNQSD